jgi:hypothetical protein
VGGSQRVGNAVGAEQRQSEEADERPKGFYEGDGRGTPRLNGIAGGVHASPRTSFTLAG